MKEKLLTRQSGIRHLIMLGIACSLLIAYCVIISLFDAWGTITAAITELNEKSGKGMLFSVCSMFLFATAIHGVLLYWCARKLIGPYLKKSFFSLLGWLPLLRNYDPYTEREKLEFQARKERRQSDRENPIIVKETFMEEIDEYGNTMEVTEDVLKNPVKPVREEIRAFFRNVIKRVARGIGSLIVAFGVPIALCVGIVMLLLWVLNINDIRIILPLAIAMIVFILILFVIHPTLALLKKDCTEASKEIKEEI